MNFLHRLEKYLTIAVLTLFLCIQWGPLARERERWGLAFGQPFVKEIALTFDDGPRDRGMYELLAMLKRLDVKATFFVVGKFAERYADTTKDMAAAGHEIENHSYTHPKLYTLWVEKIMRETERCDEVLEALSLPRSRFMRPPGGGFNLKIFYAMRRMNVKLGLWSLNTADYTAPKTGKTPRMIAEQVIKKAKPGSVVLMHSGVFETVGALPAIVSELRERGYEFVTMRELWDRGTI